MEVALSRPIYSTCWYSEVASLYFITTIRSAQGSYLRLIILRAGSVIRLSILHAGVQVHCISERGKSNTEPPAHCNVISRDRPFCPPASIAHLQRTKPSTLFGIGGFLEACIASWISRLLYNSSGRSINFNITHHLNSNFKSQIATISKVHSKLDKMLLKTTFLPLWLASLGASIAIPLRKPTSSRGRYPLTDDPEPERLSPSKAKREQDSDLYAYGGDASKPKGELDGDLYNYVNGDSVNYKAKREQDSDLYAYGGDASKPKSELDGDLYNYVNGNSVNYKAKREQDSGLYSKPPKGTCKGGGPGCFCPNGEPGCTPLEEAKRELDGDLYNYVNGDSVSYKAKRELDGDLYNYVDGDSVNYKAKREQDSGLYSKPPKGNPNYPYCPGPPGCAPP